MPPLDAEYSEYLGRAQQRMGAKVGVGQYAKVAGRLVKKLTYDEFVARWERYREVREAFDESLQRGDTVNDAVMQLLEEAAAELLLEVK